MSKTTEPLQGLRRHKLLPADVRRKLPKLCSQDGKGDQAIVHLKLFNAYGLGTWYITEGEQGEGDFIFFGYCISPLGPDCNEWGYASLNEMATTTKYGRIPAIERDCYFAEGKTVEECIAGNL